MGKRAIALFSGGLDSTLAAKLVSMQGVEVTALHIDIGFGSLDDKSAHLEYMAKCAGAQLKIVDAKKEFLQSVLFDAKYGYGKNFNPCIDCHGFMFAMAKSMLQTLDAEFLISGEVVGQRPMSQNRLALRSVVKISQTKEILLRPLSAQLLDPTKPEIEGWVDRDKLLDIHGRGRARQLALAKELGIEHYESPAGGCLLTDVGFSNRLKEFIEYKDLEVADIDILKAGRHLRLDDGAKLVVGRDKADNEKLQKISNSNYTFITQDVVGPVSLLWADATQKERELAAKIVATYSKHEQKAVHVTIGDVQYSVQPFASKKQIQPYLIQ